MKLHSWKRKETTGHSLAVPVDSAFGSTYYYKKDCDRYKACKRVLAEMICSDIQPLSIVDDPGFLKYSFTLDPKFVVPSRPVVQNEVMDLYESTKASIIHKMQTEIAKYCLTFDIWTSRSQDAYLSLTIHYIHSGTWQLCDLRLGVNKFEGRHGAEDIAEKIMELLEEWNLPFEKMSAATCDNASNNVKCFREHLKVPRAPCLGHVLNLAVNDALKVRGVTEPIARCRKLVEHFDKSRAASEALTAKQAELNMKPHKLIQDVQTRWNSTFFLLERLLEQKDAVLAVIREGMTHENAPLPAYIPNEGEWKILLQITGLLRPFFDITTWISPSSYQLLVHL